MVSNNAPGIGHNPQPPLLSQPTCRRPPFHLLSSVRPPHAPRRVRHAGGRAPAAPRLAPLPAPAPAPVPATKPSPPTRSGIPPRYDLDAKWDACLDLSICRVAYSSLAGAFGGLILFRSPTTRWASVALGAGVVIGAAFTKLVAPECSYIFNGSPPKWGKVSISLLPLTLCPSPSSDCLLHHSK
ncbi:uncharacterized protein LOC125533096 [Triticum urartu]|uniref:uncharacterized protein LOC125533096 n=1 Tax=Triticum urartu TaxID=4572 RepID=UPI0020447FB6|nr:uncharacterized protein LOC125533096 [Triticum urartu]